ncbi:hypothetical protein ACEPAI_4432 [Sanghuangporus weigelae]
MHCDERLAAGKKPERSLYAAYKGAEREAGRKLNASVSWTNEHAKQALENEPEEIKQREALLAIQYNAGEIESIETKPDDGKDEEAGDPSSKSKSPETEKLSQIDTCIEAVPCSLRRALDSFHKQTGWCGSFIVGGPQPRKGGELACYVFHKGETHEFHNEWPQTDDLYKSNIVESYKHFLQLAFPAERRETFVLKSDEAPNSNSCEQVTVFEENNIEADTLSASRDSDQAVHPTNESIKKSARKRKKKFSELDEESSDNDDIEISASDCDMDKDEGNETMDIVPRPVRQTPEERKRDANIRGINTMFRLRSIYEIEPEKLEKIDKAFFGLEVDVDDMDVANTILARAGLPSMDASAPDPLAELSTFENTMEEQVTKKKASKDLDLPPRPKNPLRKSFIDETDDGLNNPLPEHIVSVPTSLDTVVLPCSTPQVDSPTAIAPIPAVEPPSSPSIVHHTSQINNITRGTGTSAASDLQEDVQISCVSKAKQTAGSVKRNRGHPRKQAGNSSIEKENLSRWLEQAKSSMILSRTRRGASTMQSNVLSHSTVLGEDAPNSKPLTSKGHELQCIEAATTPSEPSDTPTWIDGIVQELRSIWPSAKWKALLKSWKLFEVGGHGDKGREFPLSKAPIEVRTVLQIVEGLPENFDLPYVHSGLAFSAIWWNWWVSCQPKWRIAAQPKTGSPAKLKMDISRENNLDGLRCGGKKGLLVVILGLALWVHAVEHSQQSTKSLATAITDVSWVLKALASGKHDLRTGTHSEKKRPAEIPKAPSRKKSRSS